MSQYYRARFGRGGRRKRRAPACRRARQKRANKLEKLRSAVTPCEQAVADRLGRDVADCAGVMGPIYKRGLAGMDSARYAARYAIVPDEAEVVRFQAYIELYGFWAGVTGRWNQYIDICGHARGVAARRDLVALLGADGDDSADRSAAGDD